MLESCILSAYGRPIIIPAINAPALKAAESYPCEKSRRNSHGITSLHKNWGGRPRNHPVNSRRGARFVEVRRRTRPMVLFTNLQSVQRITAAGTECLAPR